MKLDDKRKCIHCETGTQTLRSLNDAGYYHNWVCKECGKENFELISDCFERGDAVNDRIFKGNYPTGIIYADRDVPDIKDFKRLAYLNYSTLVLDIEKDCPEELTHDIIEDAKKIQSRKGEFYQISTCGQGVTLGEPYNEGTSRVKVK
jgi:hypothetical protein